MRRRRRRGNAKYSKFKISKYKIDETIKISKIIGTDYLIWYTYNTNTIKHRWTTVNVDFGFEKERNQKD